jgi:hypothetical protein
MAYRWNGFTDRLRHSFSLKRTKITLYIAAVLWVAVAAQMVMNRSFKDEIQITEAFVKSNTDEMKSSLEIIADYKNGYLSETSKKDIIYNLADAIGLLIENDVTVLKDTDRSEYYIFKQAKKASTELKVVSVEEKQTSSANMKNYIIARINIQDGIQSIDKYKKSLEKTLDEIGTDNRQVTLKYEGNREGSLTSQQKHEVAQLLVDDLQGRIALEYDEGDLYTVYAYTGRINEYVNSMGNKINMQIAITYNELTNKTKITLATPVLNESW